MKKFISLLFMAAFLISTNSSFVDAKPKKSYTKTYKKKYKKRYKKTYRKRSSRKRFRGVRRIGRSSTISILKRVKPRGLPLNLAKAVITIESRWNPNARGAAGEKGLMQLMPATSRAWGGKNSFNVRLNLKAGTRYLNWCYKRARKNISKTIACYNAGPGNMHRGHKIRITRKYISRVKRMLRRR